MPGCSKSCSICAWITLFVSASHGSDLIDDDYSQVKLVGKPF
jgi:hypothetical protein